MASVPLRTRPMTTEDQPPLWVNEFFTTQKGFLGAVKGRLIGKAGGAPRHGDRDTEARLTSAPVEVAMALDSKSLEFLIRRVFRKNSVNYLKLGENVVS